MTSTSRTSRAGDFLDRLAGGIERRRQHRQLRALSDHLLRDIGLTRDQIEAAFRGVPRG